MKNWRRWILFALLSVVLLTAGAAACERSDRLGMDGDCAGVETEVPGEVRLLSVDLEGAEAVLIEGILQMQESISVKEFGLTREDLSVLMNRIMYDDPELFVLGREYTYYLGSDNLVTRVLPQYLMSREEYVEALDIYKAEVKAIAGMVKQKWSIVEKLLFVHDYLASQYEYDVQLEIHDTYRFFTEGKGVCEAYTLASIAILQELGIEVSYVTSDELVHAWNLVKVDGEWYHMDVTHDDPLYDRLGYARHENFLLSHDAMAARKEVTGSDWMYGVDTAGTGDLYDAYFWQEAVSPFVFAEQDDIWYYVAPEGLRSWDGTSKTGGALLDSFEDIQTGDYIYSDSPVSGGLSLCGDRLYYNSYYTIREYDLDKDCVVILKTLDPDEKNLLIGMRANGETLDYHVRNYGGSDPWNTWIETMDVREFVSVGDHYSYFRNGDKLELRLNDGRRVYIAVYETNGAMSCAICCEASGSYEVSGERICLFVLDSAGWIPLSGAVIL